MTDFHIRAATDEDTAAMVAAYQAVFPALVINEASVLHSRATAKGLGEFLAVREGRIVGLASIASDMWAPDGLAFLTLGVVPDERGRGVGTALLERAAGHNREVGGHPIRTRSHAGESTEWGVRRGFTAGRASRVSRCDLAELPPSPQVPDGVRIVPLSALPDLRALHEADTLSSRDIPGRVGGDLSFEDWRGNQLADPRLDRELSLVALAGDRIAAMTYVHRAGDRVNSAYTGTHPDHRGRGLATLLKTLALRASAEAGASVAFTNNDAENVPMLAVNTRLGYRPFVTSVTLLRD